jgi:tetratricopeptide (TPR) repeat protein
MLPDELSQANKEATRQRLLTLYLAAAIVAAGLLVLGGMKFFGPAGEELQQVHVEETASFPLEDTAELRDQFKQILKYYESDIENQIVTANLSAWNQKAYSDIHSLKKQALSAFGKGDYKRALDVLKHTSALAEQVLIEWQERYSAAYLKALSLFNEGSPDKAKIRIDAALILKPSNPEALILKQRIDVLPTVNRLLLEANTARVENNVHKELKALKEIVVLDPARVELKDKFSALEGQIAEEEFASFIDAGLKAVDAYKLKKARSALRSAKAIFPSRREIQILGNRISKLARTLSLSNAIKKGDQAARRDDWAFALVTYREALKSHPDNAELTGKVQIARRIVSLSNSISDYLGRHYRLASKNVALMAKKALEDAGDFSDMSRSLALKAAELTDMLAKYNRPADLIVKSDNNTYITVRGVGNIGLVNEKLIRLKPGKYTLEGKRPGFKSRLLDVVIKPDQGLVEVQVICDERI